MLIELRVNKLEEYSLRQFPNLIQAQHHLRQFRIWAQVKESSVLRMRCAYLTLLFEGVLVVPCGCKQFAHDA